MQKPRVTEIQVRMDCNGCVQKIKRALHGINGIYDIYIDFPQQKITIVGCADLEKIVKAIKKTRKSAIICSHTEPPDEPEQAAEPENQGTDAQPAPEPANPPPTESANPPPPTESSPPPAEAAQAMEPPKDQVPQENTKPDTKPSPDAAEASANNPVQPPTGPKDVEEVHVIYHHAPDYGYRYGYNHNIGHGYNGQWHQHQYSSSAGFRPEPPQPYSSAPGFRPEHLHHYSSAPGFRPEPPQPYSSAPGFRPEPLHHYSSAPGFRPEPPPPPVYVTHSYNTHRPSPYVTGYEYVRSPPQYTPPPPPPPPPPQYTPPQYTQPQYMHYNQMVRYSEDYHHGSNSNGNVTAIFSDENPNACRIV